MIANHKKMSEIIPFNRPYFTGKEQDYINKTYLNGQISGDGPFTKSCHEWLQTHLRCNKVLLTHSCTAALEMAAILLNLAPGDEVIMPSYTFISTANSFVLRKAVPVFIDIREDTLNINEELIEEAITPKTKAILVVHYAGVSCEMNKIMRIAKKYNLFVVEDAAQGILSKYKDKFLGTIGHLGCISFHETKNITSGEGGALIINDKKFIPRAEIIREKGSDRSQFFRGEVDKYTWRDIGSSFLPGELISSFLLAQLRESKSITEKRIKIWNKYYVAFKELANKGVVSLPKIPQNCSHNGHIFFLLFKNLEHREYFITRMRESGILCIFHYIPLHLSEAGKKYAKVYGTLRISENVANQIVRLPLWIELDNEKQKRVINSALKILEDLTTKNESF